MKNYDVIVIGGGHAGIEAAAASANIGVKTLLVTTKLSTIGMTPCNPSVGGPAKGNVVKEIDALGGLMGKITNKSMIQIKKLNRSKGPAVQALRAQIDSEMYPKIAYKYICNIKGLDILEGFVTEIITKNKKIQGIKIADEIIFTKKIVLTTGTYMDSYIIKGHNKISSGPEGLPTSSVLSSNLKKLGIKLFRLKTGTPARVKKSTIDFSNATLAPGDNEELSFSFWEKPNFDYKNQSDCYLIHTTEKTHKIIRDNIHLSGYDSGIIEGVGARYCPSIEDKLVRFADKERHQIFLEPETKTGDTIYVQGFSTSMPDEIQKQMIHSLPGLENAEILKYGYAIEYEAIFPEQLKRTLELKTVQGLYTAGQINGTSGYEEAAGQGIIAGINAALNVLEKEPFYLTRANSYIGLMIDDLILKGTTEPYRLLTSRSEYRLYLRNDNADQRLSQKAYEIGLLNYKNYEKFQEKQQKTKELLEISKKIIISPKDIDSKIFKEIEIDQITTGVTLESFIRRPKAKFKYIKKILDIDDKYENVFEEVEIEIKYEGYINKIDLEIKKLNKNEQRNIPENIDFTKIPNLALEAREKLTKIKPETIGQASRISGVNPSDISILLVYLKKGWKI